MQPHTNDVLSSISSTPEGQRPAEGTGSQLPDEVSPLIQRGIDAFRRDLPELLKTHSWQWVAYHGDERIGISRSRIKLVQECVKRGWSRFDYVVLGIEPALLASEEWGPECSDDP